MTLTIGLMEGQLLAKFSKSRVNSVLKHFINCHSDFKQGKWASATVATGRFVEAVLKLLLEYTLLSVPEDRDFKPGHAIDQLGKLEREVASESVRLTIPRACRFVYDVASNRGSRHDSSTLDPNFMDAQTVCGLSSWVLAELIRLSSGDSHPASAAMSISRIMSRKYPLIEDIDGRVYIHKKGLSARRLGLVILAHRYPERTAQDDLIDSIVLQGEKRGNARTAVSRLKKAKPKIVDCDNEQTLVLLMSRLEEAESLLQESAL